MPEPLVYWNDRFLPQSQARLTLHDAGFVQGATVTDLVRTFQGRLYRFEDHLERFGNSCRSAEIYPPCAIDDIARWARELVEHNLHLPAAGPELALVLFCTPGPIGYYLGEETGPPGPTFGMHTFPLPFGRYRPWIQKGVSLVVPRVRQLGPDVIDPRIKQRSRLHWYLADREAQRMEPGALALLQDQNGYLTETAAANLLIIHRGQAISPPTASILEGISLRIVRELLPEVGLDFVERPLTLADCFAAEEIWLTCTTFCLAGVSRVQGRPVPFPGPWLGRLEEKWSGRVGMGIHRQILGSDLSTSPGAE